MLMPSIFVLGRSLLLCWHCVKGMHGLPGGRVCFIRTVCFIAHMIWKTSINTRHQSAVTAAQTDYASERDGHAPTKSAGFR